MSHVCQQFFQCILSLSVNYMIPLSPLQCFNLEKQQVFRTHMTMNIKFLWTCEGHVHSKSPKYSTVVLIP